MSDEQIELASQIIAIIQAARKRADNKWNSQWETDHTDIYCGAMSRIETLCKRQVEQEKSA